MKKRTQIFGIGLLFSAMLLVFAADHIDAPAVAGGSSDITDYYVFQGNDTNNLVFVANLQGLLSPSKTAEASFDGNVMIEFNIDNNGDNIEDLVIQAVTKNGKMYFIGPVAPSQTGIASKIEASNFGNDVSFVKITPYGSEAIVATEDGKKFFAGPRDDPFFMDFAQYVAIVGGNASSFNNPGADTFAGTNVLSVAVEVPKELLGDTSSINTWVESKRKQ